MYLFCVRIFPVEVSVLAVAQGTMVALPNNFHWQLLLLFVRALGMPFGTHRQFPTTMLGSSCGARLFGRDLATRARLADYDLYYPKIAAAAFVSLVSDEMVAMIRLRRCSRIESE